MLDNRLSTSCYQRHSQTSLAHDQQTHFGEKSSAITSRIIFVAFRKSLPRHKSSDAPEWDEFTDFVNAGRLESSMNILNGVKTCISDGSLSFSSWGYCWRNIYATWAECFSVSRLGGGLYGGFGTVTVCVFALKRTRHSSNTLVLTHQQFSWQWSKLGDEKLWNSASTEWTLNHISDGL